MSIVFFGTPLFSVPSLKALVESGEKVEAVVTQKDKRRGRGRVHVLLPPPVKEFAISRGIGVIQPSSVKDEGFIRELSDLRPEFIVVVAYGKILPGAVLEIPPRGAINLHASLLPKYRGASPIARAIINGDSETGVTTMFMSKGLDEGDILLQEPVKIRNDDTTETLSERLSEAGALLLVKTLKGLRQGTLTPRPQTGNPSYAPPFKKHDGRVDWSKTAEEIYNFVRGMYPWPGAYCYMDGERVKLLRIKPLKGEGPAGAVIKITDDSFLIGAGKGLVQVIQLQPEGKRLMTTKAFLQGRKIRQGTVIM